MRENRKELGSVLTLEGSQGFLAGRQWPYLLSYPLTHQPPKVNSNTRQHSFLSIV